MKTALQVIALILMIDVLFALWWAVSGQQPQGFYLGQLTHYIIGLI